MRLRIHGQLAVDTPGANPSGVITTNLATSQLVAPYAVQPVALVHVVGSKGPVGIARAGVGFVVELR